MTRHLIGNSRLPGFQRGKDRITIIGKSIGVSSPGNIYVHALPFCQWNCGPNCLWAEFFLGRNDPESLRGHNLGTISSSIVSLTIL